MKVRFLGMVFRPCNDITAAEVITEAKRQAKASQSQLQNALQKEQSGQDSSGEFIFPPVFAMERLDQDYIAGVVIKVRDARKVFQVAGQDGELMLKTQDLAEGTRNGEVNFFVLRESDFSCVYAYSHLSTHCSRFGAFFKQAHTTLVKRKKKQIEDAVIAKRIKRTEATKQKKALKALEFDILVNSKSAADLVKELNHVSSTVMTFSVFDQAAGPATIPVKAVADRMSIRFGFDRNPGSLSAVKDALYRSMKNDDLKKMRIEGQDAAGLDKVIYLDENLEHFAEADYDSLMGDVDIDLESIKEALGNSKVVKKLRKVAEAKDFEIRVKAALKTSSS